MYEVYFETYGCTANKNSCEIMKGLVKQAGLNVTANLEYADILVINSCIVKEATRDKIKFRVKELCEKYPEKKIILAGCMPRLFKDQFNKRNLFLLDTSQIKKITDLIKDIFENNYVEEKYLYHRNEIKLNLPKINSDKITGITQISEGCLGECSYCIVRVAKGKLNSYPIERIFDSVQRDVYSGCKEIQITSQDNAAYGNEAGKYSLPSLLSALAKINGEFRIRVGMMNPNNLNKILPEMINLYKNTKIFKFLHIPIQSGSNKILKEMKRKYTSEDILKIIREIKKQIPEILIATDIIVGFPGESEEDWKKTIDLIKEIKPEILNRSNFSDHKEVESNLLPEKISSEIINKRAKELQELHLQICSELQEKEIGKQMKVLITSKGWKGTWLGRAENYKLVVVNSNENLLGKIVNVKIVKSSVHYLFALTI